MHVAPARQTASARSAVMPPIAISGSFVRDAAWASVEIRPLVPWQPPPGVGG